MRSHQGGMDLSIFRTYRKPIISGLVDWSTACPHGAALGDASILVGAYPALTPRVTNPSSARAIPLAWADCFLESRDERIKDFTRVEGDGLCVPARNPDDFFRDVLW